MQRVLFVVALAMGALVTYVDTRPTWDDTGVTVAALFAFAGCVWVLGAGAAMVVGASPRSLDSAPGDRPDAELCFDSGAWGHVLGSLHRGGDSRLDRQGTIVRIVVRGGVTPRAARPRITSP